MLETAEIYKKNSEELRLSNKISLKLSYHGNYFYSLTARESQNLNIKRKRLKHLILEIRKVHELSSKVLSVVSIFNDLQKYLPALAVVRNRNKLML